MHNWVRKADLQPEGGKRPNHIAVDETVIQLNAQRFWVYAAVDLETNEILDIRLFPIQIRVLIKQFLKELQEKHDVGDAVFLVDGAPWLQAALFDENHRFQHVTHGNRNAVKYIIRNLGLQTKQFANYFHHTSAESVETCLQTFVLVENRLI